MYVLLTGGIQRRSRRAIWLRFKLGPAECLRSAKKTVLIAHGFHRFIGVRTTVGQKQSVTVEAKPAYGTFPYKCYTVPTVSIYLPLYCPFYTSVVAHLVLLPQHRRLHERARACADHRGPPPLRTICVRVRAQIIGACARRRSPRPRACVAKLL
jgi:hypothetical protein